jgi:hypothetical protein
MKIKRILSFITLITICGIVLAQDMNCNVQVLLSPKISSSDRRLTVFNTLQGSVTEFMNNTKWTNDVFKTEERIEADIIITITDVVSINEFSASAQIQSNRPIYRTSYNTPLINHNDPSFSFSYTEFEPLQYSDNQDLTNLVALLSFYAHMIIGYDYDSYSLNGGEPYFTKAQRIVNNAQQNGSDGWKPFENNRNRYWFVENMLNQAFKPFREAVYVYHRLGLDVMSEDAETARTEIENAITLIQKTHEEKPRAMGLQMFFTAKAEEIANSFSEAQPAQKNKLVPILTKIDPAHAQVYAEMVRRR